MQFAQHGIIASGTNSDIIESFRARVIADGGTFEGDSCLQNEVNVLGNFYNVFDIILTPNAYKASKIYALKPTNGDVDLAFTRATTATRRRSTGKIEPVSSNVPRVNHRLGNSCAEQLMEASARTNLLLRSEEFSNASWTKTNCTVTADSIDGPGPDPSTADAIFETTTSGQHRLEQAITKAGSQLRYILTAYIKPNGRDWVYFSLRNGGNGVNVFFNVTTLVRGTVFTFGTGFTFASSRITDEGNGWCRVMIHVQSNTTTALTSIIASSLTDNPSADYVGDITKGFYIWGAQLEQATFDTSYIPTTSAAATRNAEVLSNKTGISTHIGQTEGTIYFKGNVQLDSTEKRIVLTDGTSGKRIALVFGTDNKARLYIENSTVQCDLTAQDVYRTDSEVRFVAVYANNRAALFMNGIKVGEDLTVSVPATLDRITFNDVGNFYATWKLLAFSKTAISDSQAEALSSPVSYPPVTKLIVPFTLSGDPDYYAFGNGLSLDEFFPDISIYIAKRGPSHYLDGGNTFGMLYHEKHHLWSTPFEIEDTGTTYLSGVSAGLVGNKIFIQVARYTVSGGVDTFSDIGYITSVDLTTLSSAEDLRDSSSWNAYTTLPAPTYPRYEAYGKILPSTATPGKYFSLWFEHNSGVEWRLNCRKIIDGVSYTISNIQVFESAVNKYGEPSLVHAGGSNWLIFARQNGTTAGTRRIGVFSSTDDCETWSHLGVSSNLGSGSAHCVVDTFVTNGNINIIYQDRGTGFIMISRNNTYANCLAMTFNTPQPFDYNGFSDSTNGIGYPSVWEIRPDVFMVTYCKETTQQECHVYGTLYEFT